MQTKEAVSVIQRDTAGSVLRYQKDDVLGITVNASGESSVAVSDFNLPLQPIATTENSTEFSVAQGLGRHTYLVNAQGDIDFPVLGAIKVEGLTQGELEFTLKQALKKYLKTDPIITVRLMNYRVSVLGEVARPGQYGVVKNHINIFEALALAGDMSIYGRRDNVRLMRTLPDGETQIIKLNLNNPELINSPYFYLQQDDMLYIEPNKVRAKSSDIGSQTSILLSIGSMLLTVVNLVVLIILR